jgi:hypothetical protein
MQLTGLVRVGLLNNNNFCGLEHLYETYIVVSDWNRRQVSVQFILFFPDAIQFGSTAILALVVVV